VAARAPSRRTGGVMYYFSGKNLKKGAVERNLTALYSINCRKDSVNI